MRLKLHILGSFIFALAMVLWATTYDVKPQEVQTPVPFLQSKQRWADSLIRKFDRSEKITQLFMVVAESDSLDSDSSFIQKIKDYKPGGVLFRDLQSVEQWRRSQLYQRETKVPLMIGMRPGDMPSDLLQMPDDLSLAAINQDSLFTEIGTAMALQAMEMGVNAYFLPTLYQNQTPENRMQITEKLLKVGDVLQSQRILAIPTGAYPYFPYEKDSVRLDSLLKTYQRMAKAGISGLGLEPKVIEKIKLNSRKESIVKNALDANIDFRGLIVGEIIAESEPVEEQVKKMMKAGVDLIILREKDLKSASATIHNLMNRSVVSGPMLNEKVKRVLLAKSWSRTRSTHLDLLKKDTFDLNVSGNALLNRKLIREAITIALDPKDQIPFKSLQKRRFHVLTVGEKAPDLLNQMRFYTEISDSHISRKEKKPLRPLNVRTLAGYHPLVIAFNKEIPDENRDADFLESLAELSEKTEVIVLNFGKTKDLKLFSPKNALVQVYGNSDLHQKLVAQAVFGGVAVNGMLPLSLNEDLRYGQGDYVPKIRLSYTIPEEVGLDSRYISYIDSIMYEGMGSFAMPGGQVLVAKAGDVIYHKAFGYHTYARKRPVKLTDLYDIASITKVAGTTAAAMKMYDQGRMDVDDMLGKFFRNQMVVFDSVISSDTVYLLADSVYQEPKKDTIDSPVILVSQREKKGVQVDSFFFGDTIMVVSTQRGGRTKVKSKIFKLRISELLTHHSGLPAAMPIIPYVNYRNKRIGRYGMYYKSKKDSLHDVKVAGGFFLRRDYLDSLWEDTKRMIPDRQKRYEYSDANMVLVQMAIDSANKEPINHYLNRELYAPLGLQNARYNPHESLDDMRLVPTEYDGRWRGQLLRGYVHDPTAAIMGGVAGNAGLFSNANDLGILFQLFLNEGKYGGETHLRSSTIKKFTQAQTGHRGFGFDKPPQVGGYIIGDAASLSSYGHTGFSGTCVWVDPEHDLVFIFLSNRIHPRAQNWKLNTMRIRQRVHDAIYEAIENPLP